MCRGVCVRASVRACVHVSVSGGHVTFADDTVFEAVLQKQLEIGRASRVPRRQPASLVNPHARVCVCVFVRLSVMSIHNV